MTQHKNVLPPSAGSLKLRADAVLEAAVSRGMVPGVVAAVTDPQRTLYEGARGSTSLAGSTPMDPDTVMALFSMTKPLTSAAALQLVARGKLELDTPAAWLLPELARIQVLDGVDDHGRPRLRPPRRPPTLRHLLTHTSGFTYDIWDADLKRYCEEHDIPRFTSGRTVALQVPLAFDPGERWQYGLGIDWAGRLIEAASGLSLGDYLERNLTGPLGMTSTRFVPDPGMRSRLADMHTRDRDGTLSVLAFSRPPSPEFEAGGSGLYSTANDYLKFLRMILNRGKANGDAVLEPGTLALMSRNAIGTLQVGALRSAMPHTSLDAEFFPGVRKTWSLAGMINEDATPTGRSPGSLSWAGVGNTYFWIDPARGIAGLALMQILPFFDPLALGVFLDFEKGVNASWDGARP